MFKTKTGLRLEGKNRYLVVFSERHLKDPAYLSWLHDYDVMKTIYRPEYHKTISFTEVEKYYQRLLQRDDAIFFAIHDKATDDFIGTCKIQAIDLVAKQAEVGVMVGDKHYWGKGVGTDAIAIMARYVFEELKFRKLWAGLMATNPAMLRVFTKLGFKEEGKLRDKFYIDGEYVDHIFVGCFKDEFKDLN